MSAVGSAACTCCPTEVPDCPSTASLSQLGTRRGDNSAMLLSTGLALLGEGRSSPCITHIEQSCLLCLPPPLAPLQRPPPPRPPPRPQPCTAFTFRADVSCRLLMQSPWLLLVLLDHGGAELKTVPRVSEGLRQMCWIVCLHSLPPGLALPHIAAARATTAAAGSRAVLSAASSLFVYVSGMLFRECCGSSSCCCSSIFSSASRTSQSDPCVN